MPAFSILRLLYLGRQSGLAQEVRAIWQETRTSDPSLSPFSLQIVYVPTQDEAMDILRAHTFHAAILEVDNQQQHRTRFCRDLRKRFPELRIFALCHTSPHPRRFDFDGELRKPLVRPEVIVFLHSICSRRDAMQIRIGPVHLDMTARTVHGPRGAHPLPPKQCALLWVLMNHWGQVVSRETIMRIVWETEYLADTRTLDVHIRWLREKIEPNPSDPVHLVTVRGQGYQFFAG